MTEPLPQPRGWRYGLHPAAKGARISAFGRSDLPLGEALRIEMASAEPGDDDSVHVQYYIATELGPWALWISCARSELDEREAILSQLSLPFDSEP